MPHIKDFLPPPDKLLQLEPEEISMFILRYVCAFEKERAQQYANRYNLTLAGNLADYAPDGALRQEVAKVITEGWVWLEGERMLAPKPDEQHGDWVFVTRRGKCANQEGNLKAYVDAVRLPEGALDPVLARKVRPLFVRGDYEVSVFQAFKVVEVRVRTIARLPRESISTKLMREAFDVQNGPLSDMARPTAEREAMAHLFTGAIGLYKNPSSHRDVDLSDPDETAELILLANHLLRLIGRQGTEPE